MSNATTDPIAHFIELTRLANEAGIAGDHRKMISLRDERRGFGDCWAMMTGRSFGLLLIEADLAVMETYGDANMCGGILNDFTKPAEVKS